MDPLVEGYWVSLLVLLEDLKQVVFAQLVIAREVEDAKREFLPEHGATLAKLSEDLEVAIEGQTKEGPEVEVQKAEHALCDFLAVSGRQVSFEEASIHLGIACHCAILRVELIVLGEREKELLNAFVLLKLQA